jgi:hypothetical protein
VGYVMNNRMIVHFRKDTPDVTVLLHPEFPPAVENGLYLVRDINGKLWSFNLDAVTYVEMEYRLGGGK